MTREYLLQPWTTIKAAGATATVTQPMSQWCDISDVDDAVLRIETGDMTNSILTIETSQTVSGPWNDLSSTSTPSTKSSVAISSDPDASAQLQRFVRWSLAASGANSTASFQLSIRSRRSKHDLVAEPISRESSVIQPWTTLIGGASFTGGDIIVPVESYWVDSEGLEKLQLEVETIELTTANIIIEGAMAPEGPWTELEPITTTGTTSLVLETKDGATDLMARYIRWHIDSSSSPWQACFRINGRSWP